ncbi:hypothetical protein JMJ35_007181 [Cladonia borealis]|uniref:Uncharacterized protein n=1 Tax=Cladonia borealis TaxID=184061 RepID=A0AA39V438_9LECA|nr:hypothetical protein JMJ35_007181 [Cladonia borealis]
MCRVRFGLTDIHFEECRPSLPRESYYRPLVVAIPSIVEKRQEKSGSRPIAKGVTEKKDVVGVTPNVGITKSYKKSQSSGVKAFDGSARSSSLSSSLLRDDGGPNCTGTRVKLEAPTTGIKRPRTLSSSSSSLSDESWPRKPTKNTTRQLATTPAVLPKLASPTKTKCNIKCTKASALKSTKKSGKAPPTKKVRFVMDMGDAMIPHHPVSDTSSSHSSDVSYTDPPSPVEPYDAYSGYYRAPGASRTHGNKYNTASLLARWQREEEFGTDWLFDSEEGSEVDVQHLPVKNTPLKLMHYNGIRLQSDRMHPNTSLALLKRPGTGPQGIAWDLESEMGSRQHCAGLQPMESHLQWRKSAMPRHPVEGPKRSGKKFLEPASAKSKSYTEREHDRMLIPERHQASEKAKKKAKRKAKTYLPPQAITEDIEDDRQRSTP